MARSDESGAASIPITLGPITVENIKELRKLNAASLPVAYNEQFYRETTKGDTALNKFAYHKNRVVGAICTRVDAETNDDDSPPRLTILTLAILAPYRGHGIGSTLLQSVLDHVTSRESGCAVQQVVLHVQVSNPDAIRFYTTKFDFVQGELVRNYYNKRVHPPDCYCLYKSLL